MRLNIYHTNDIHANFAFLGRVCAYLEEHRTESDLYLDSGDFLDLKSLVVQADRGGSALALAKFCRMDTMALGNNEIDLGSEDLKKLTSFPLLCANICRNDGSPVPGLKSHLILERCGKRFLIIGLAPFYGLGMLADKYNVFFEMGNLHTLDPVPAVTQILRENRGKYDFSILLSHSGHAVDRELAKRLPGALSGGQQQRAALARILAAQPRILMLDEPFSALDSYLREEVEGEVGSLLAGFAGTALLVTHNRDEAYRLCREMIVMDSGEVLRAGTTKEVFADPRTRAAARLTGCKNILPCTRVGEHTVYLAGWEQPLTVALPVPEGCRAVGIRAHDFAPCAPGTPNSLPVQAVSTSENPFDWNMIFTLPGGEARLWWKVSKETMAAPPPKAPACLAAAPENIMPLV